MENSRGYTEDQETAAGMTIGDTRMSRPEPMNDDERERLKAEIAALDRQIESLRETEAVLENAVISSELPL